MAWALRDVSRSSAKNRGSRTSSLAQRKPTRLIEDQCGVRSIPCGMRPIARQGKSTKTTRIISHNIPHTLVPSTAVTAAVLSRATACASDFQCQVTESVLSLHVNLRKRDAGSSIRAVSCVLQPLNQQNRRSQAAGGSPASRFEGVACRGPRGRLGLRSKWSCEPIRRGRDQPGEYEHTWRSTVRIL